MKIALSRFKWKPSPWMKPENILSIWVYCYDGNLEFEFEIDSDVEINKDSHSEHSKNKSKPNFVQITDPEIIHLLEKKMDDFDVCGAKSGGIIVGEVDIPIGKKNKTLIVLSTLKDWKIWLETRQFMD